MVTSGSDKGRNWEVRHDLSYHVSFIWLIEGGLKESRSDSEAAGASWGMLVFSRYPKYLHQTSRLSWWAACIHCRLH